MKTLHKIKPYSDEKLTWDENSEQYVLTKQYFKATYDSVYADDGVLEKRLRENSKLIYRFIKNRTYSRNRPVVKNVLNYTQEGRDFIFELLDAQISADAETGYNDLSKTPAINVANGQIIDRNELYRNQVCVDAEQVFDDSDSYFGFRIGYQCPFPPIFFVLFK